MTNDFLFAVLKALTVITSVGLLLSPIPVYVRVIKDKTTGDFSIMPAATIFFACYVWVVYGCLIGNYVPLVATDSTGVAAAVVFMAIFYQYTPDRAYVRKLWALAALWVTVVTSFTGIAIAAGLSHEQTANVLGFVAAGLDICMYASPLATIRHVVAIKDASSMPLTMSVVALVNSLLWVAVSTDDLFLAVPNGIASVTSVVSIVLYFIYRPGKYPTAQADAADVDSISIKSVDKAGYGELQSPVVNLAGP